MPTRSARAREGLGQLPREALGLHADADVPGAPDGGADRGVRIVDSPEVRVHHPADLMAAILSLVGIGLVMLLAVYAHSTTLAITEDVQDFESVLQRILFVPVAALEGLITLIAPIAVLTELVLRRLVRHAFEAIAAAVVGILIALGVAWLITQVGEAVPDLRSAYSVWSRQQGQWLVTIPALLTGTAALLTAAGSRSSRRTLGWSWNLLWLALGVALITGLLTLPGALTTVLLGRATGLALRYVFGVQSERAYGRTLVDGIRRAGVDPVRVVRVSDVGADPGGDGGPAVDLAAVALTRYSDNRVYAITTSADQRLDAVVLDGDRQVLGILNRAWRSLRLRGIDGRAVVSLRQAAERAALLAHAAWSAGVCTPRLLGLTEADDSMILVQEHIARAVPLRDLPAEAMSDDVLDAIWEQLRIAHGAGLAHRSLTADVILVHPDRTACPPDSPASALRSKGAPIVLVTGWDFGDVASSDLAQRMDVSHMLAVLALRVGAERDVDSAARMLTGPELAAIGPLLQVIALPRATREEIRRRKGALTELREALLARLPEAQAEPVRLVRFGARTAIMIALGIAAAVVIITTLNFSDIAAAVREAASPWWALVAFGLGLATFFGSALSLYAFSPVKLPLWRATLVQAAAAYVSLAAPAGVGPAAINLRVLTRRGVSNTLAVASVGLVQISQLVTTIALLLTISLVSGSDIPLGMPSTAVLVAVGLLAFAITVAMLVPPLRQWALARLVPLWQTTWPRLIQLLGQPRRFALAVLGNLIMTVSYLGAFWACLAAFGRSMSLIDLAIIYLIGNAIGAMVPTPGGIGGVEGALIFGLTAPVGYAIATSVVILFRALTFWARVPFGWAAMRTLQRSGEL